VAIAAGRNVGPAAGTVEHIINVAETDLASVEVLEALAAVAAVGILDIAVEVAERAGRGAPGCERRLAVKAGVGPGSAVGEEGAEGDGGDAGSQRGGCPLQEAAPIERAGQSFTECAYPLFKH
jgi:hypothetical protein